MGFFAQYKGAVCPKEFMSEESEALDFPPHVAYMCDLCKEIHGFRLVQTYQIETPSAQKQFETFCINNHIEQRIAIPKK